MFFRPNGLETEQIVYVRTFTITDKTCAQQHVVINLSPKCALNKFVYNVHQVCQFNGCLSETIDAFGFSPLLLSAIVWWSFYGLLFPPRKNISSDTYIFDMKNLLRSALRTPETDHGIAKDDIIIAEIQSFRTMRPNYVCREHVGPYCAAGQWSCLRIRHT